MKKNLTLLTGIAFVIAILVAAGCGNKKNQNTSEEADNVMKGAEDHVPRTSIYLRDTLIDDTVHLEMYNEKHPDKKKIDSLVTEVHPGDTVFFYNAHKSKIEEISNIRLVEDVFMITREYDRIDSGLYVFIVDPGAPWDTIVKYEIVFTVKKDPTIWTIDPHLRIPPS